MHGQQCHYRTLGCLAAALAVIGAGAAYGVNPSSALVSKTEFEREHGQYVYEVEFAANGVAYDYTIKATDGAVIAKTPRDN